MSTVLKEVYWTNDYALKVISCGTCGVIHAIPETLYHHCKKEGGFWHCPNGHQRGWQKGSDKTAIDKERKRREWAEAESQRKQEEIAALVRKHKAEITKVKKRVATGVCPCCTRTFQQLARHMSNKHPEYSPTRIQK